MAAKTFGPATRFLWHVARRTGRSNNESGAFRRTIGRRSTRHRREWRQTAPQTPRVMRQEFLRCAGTPGSDGPGIGGSRRVLRPESRRVDRGGTPDSASETLVNVSLGRATFAVRPISYHIGV